MQNTFTFPTYSPITDAREARTRGDMVDFAKQVGVRSAEEALTYNADASEDDLVTNTYHDCGCDCIYTVDLEAIERYLGLVLFYSIATATALDAWEDYKEWREDQEDCEEYG